MSQQTPPPQYGPPQYGPPPQRNRGALLLIGVLVLVLIALGAVAVILLRRNDKPEPVQSAPATKPSNPDAVQFRRVLTAAPGTCASPAPEGTACGSDGMRYTLGKVELDGGNVSGVKAGAGTGVDWIVNLTLDQEGTQAFGRLTTDLAKKTPPQNQLAIVVNGRAVTAPTVMSPITAGKIQISSNFTKSAAEKLAAEITG